MKDGKQEMGSETNEALTQLRSWSDLPSEILSSIAQRLTIIDLLSFRRTCQDFCSASPGIGSCRGPWLLFHETYSSECNIYNQNRSNIFKRDIPELEGAVCLASYQGWLLVSKQESIFFFYPFSLAKIALPNFPHKQMHGRVAAFSDVPTSPHCTVFIVNDTEDYEIEINMISEGQSVWTRYLERESCIVCPLLSIFTAATFLPESQTFCFFDPDYCVRACVRAFSVKNKKWTPIVNADIPILPCYYMKYMFWEKLFDKRDQVDLEDEEYLSVYGFTYKDDKSRQVVCNNEVMNLCHSYICSTERRVRRAVWIQPRFFEDDLNQLW